jgi:hypothetical protein
MMAMVSDWCAITKSNKKREANINANKAGDNNENTRTEKGEAGKA